jgi:uncharacterized SAM-binding protein YcdF (DUF218 family)
MRNTGGRKRVGWVGVATGCTFLAAFAANAGRWLVVDDPRPADVILVLAGETEVRPARALELLQQGYGRRVVMDVPAGAKIYEFTQLQLAEKYVHDLPQKNEVALCPTQGLSTRDELREAGLCLDRERASSVVVVTSDFHTRRALSTFRHELRGRSVSVAAAHDDVQFGIRWWSHRQWAKTALDEWLRLLWWEAVERWQ